MGFQWGEEHYTRFGLDFGESGLEWSTTRPSDWPKSSHGVEEEVVESFLALHMAELTDSPARYLWRPPAMWSSADLFGTDVFERIHVFELKKAGFGAADVAQLGHYLLGLVFVAPAALRAEKAAMRASTLGDTLATYLCGAVAGIRTTNIGFKLVSEHLSEAEHADCATSAGWQRMSSEAKANLLQRALLAVAEKAGFPQARGRLDELRAVAERWSTRLAAPQPPSVLVAHRPAVTWLVARHIGDDALEQMRRWRRAGVDVRTLRLTVRLDRTNSTWHARVVREHAPQRAALEKKLMEYAANAGGEGRRETLLELYNERSPSRGRLVDGGSLLPEPRAYVGKPDDWHRIL